MTNTKTIKVEEFARRLNLSIDNIGTGSFEISNSEINLPGLQFAGSFAHFAYQRVQLVGNAEMSFYNDLDGEIQNERMKELFKYPMPAIVIARGHETPSPMLEQARKNSVPILRSGRTTTRCSHIISNYLDGILAPSVRRHGVLVDVYGVGIMLTGESGIGKSETALELIKRGHRLVADDVVDLRRVNETRIVGTSPELVRYLMELRGIGIIDVRNIYGVGAVMLEKSIELIIELEDWIENKHYDRLGMDEFYIDILGVNIPKIEMPVRPGRNLAIIVEVAARNFRLKKMGYNAAVEFDKRLHEEMEMGDDD